MPTRTLSDAARQFIAAFEEETEATARDCVVEDDRVLILVTAGDMGDAIGPGGRHVRRVEETIGRDVKLVEDADTAEAFVANALSPAAVYNVTISEDDETIAYAEVAEEDTGAAIGKGGENIEAARTLVARHYDVDDIQLT
ncbi:NusA-like transcription termination signal-binding factor [Halostella sp. JP-L12]|uniref:NusA-like transcription termination signal-binding factor n=1 Tax=Halostella TaxID=1843185 RepID=UPI000EF820BA|nr:MULTISPECIES: NusA-like transcription termination signal-binding factor [Halostella]NHN48246.1 NusA-like transcription termination signal-binding factor [Halostella sp. JP-L12]